MIMKPARAAAIGRSLRVFAYPVVIVLIAVFLYSLGAEPWLHVQSHVPLYAAIIAINLVSLPVQAASFRAVATVSPFGIPQWVLTRIWSGAAVVAVVAPVFFGLASRTVLLARAGLPVPVALTTTMRQLWLGLEYALVLGGFAALLASFEGAMLLAAALLGSGLAMITLRRATSVPHKTHATPVRRWHAALREPVPWRAHPWYVVQVAAMSAVYFTGYNGIGAEITAQESVVLATATVLVSLLVAIPNGLGVMDAIWVLLATESGVGLEESVALAIIFRVGHLTAAVLLWVALTTVPPVLRAVRPP